MKTLFFLVFTPVLFFAQLFTIEGTITERATKRPLPYANIKVIDTSLGTSANADGKYLLRLEKGNYQLVASFIGFQSDTISLQINMDIPISFKLNRTSINLYEITV